jgi:WD40 repeat protein
MGVSGQARLDRPWNLYWWSPPRDSPQPLLGGLGDPFGLAVAPDGRSLAVGGKRDGKPGLWLVNTSDGSAKHLASGEFGDPSFSPDGCHLVAVSPTDPEHAAMYLSRPPLIGHPTWPPPDASRPFGAPAITADRR